MLSASDNQIEIWQDSNLSQIKELFARDLTDKEFIVFMEMGKRAHLNPFLREIWAVKYDKHKPAQIFIGRDGYRKGAQRHPLYDYHLADAVYGNDDFGVDNGRVMHRYRLKDRGALMGAYSVVKRKDSSLPSYVFVEINEYNLKRSVWNDKPATMIKKVAEAQCLRMAFQEFFAGTYSDAENWLKATVNTKMEVIESKPIPLPVMTINLDDMLLDLSQCANVVELNDLYQRHYQKCVQAQDNDAKQKLVQEVRQMNKNLKEIERQKFVAEMDEENERQKSI